MSPISAASQILSNCRIISQFLGRNYLCNPNNCPCPVVSGNNPFHECFFSEEEHFTFCMGHSAFFKGKWASQKDFLEMIRRSQLILHIYILISKYSQPPPFYLRLHLLPNFSDKLFALTYRCADIQCWNIVDCAANTM